MHTWTQFHHHSIEGLSAHSSNMKYTCFVPDVTVQFIQFSSKPNCFSCHGDSSPHQDLVISLVNLQISSSVTAWIAMDNQLSYFTHTDNLTRSCRFFLYSIRSIFSFISTQARCLFNPFQEQTAAEASFPLSPI